jgi:putative hydrolase of the HAD superfamily
MIQNIIFDLDDTLYSQKLSRSRIIMKINEMLDSENISIELFWHEFNIINKKLLNDLAVGQLSGYEYLLIRYIMPLQKLTKNYNSLANQCRAVYFHETMHNLVLFDDVLDILNFARTNKIKMFLLTNGTSCGQRSKIHGLKLNTYIDKIYIAEEMKLFKPNIEALRTVIHKNKLIVDNTLMIGDSLDLDIFPAKQIGLKSIWVDREEQFDNEYYNVYKLKDLRDILKNNFIWNIFKGHGMIMCQSRINKRNPAKLMVISHLLAG